MDKKMQIFDYINYIMLFIISITMIYPFVNIVAVSFSSYQAFLENPLRIIPSGFTLDAYEQLMRHQRLYSSYMNTIIITVTGVSSSLVLYILTAYPLSKRELKGRKIIMVLIVFTMMFNGGLIPNYYLVRGLGLLDSLAAIVLTAMFSGFNLILVKNFFESLPESLIEAAKIDGASEPYILAKIVVPLSTPILATICLFTAVGYWNNFFSAVIYIRSPEKWTLMLFLREIIMGAKMAEMSSDGNLAELNKNAVQQVSLQYATLLLVVAPIMCVYPFLQKYFVKGIMIGSIKG